LIKAADRFDETKWYKFITYAVNWIRQAILEAIYDVAKLIRLPQNQHNLISKITKNREQIYVKYQRDATFEELVEIIHNKPPATIKESMEINSFYISLDAPIKEDVNEDFSLLDIIEQTTCPPSDTQLIQEACRNDLEKIFSLLTSQEWKVLSYYYWLEGEYPLTMEQIGEALWMSKQVIIGIQKKAIRKLSLHRKEIAQLLESR
jgi:RNA polymerase primary sigma factor